jgi:hypothetical protein
MGHRILDWTSLRNNLVSDSALPPSAALPSVAQEHTGYVGHEQEYEREYLSELARSIAPIEWPPVLIGLNDNIDNAIARLGLQYCWSPTIPDIGPALLEDTPMSAKSGMSHTERIAHGRWNFGGNLHRVRGPFEHAPGPP